MRLQEKIEQLHAKVREKRQRAYVLRCEADEIESVAWDLETLLLDEKQAEFATQQPSAARLVEALRPTDE